MSELAAYERRFRRAGMPLLIEDFSAAQDVFNRAVPFLGLVFIVEMLGAIDLQWPLIANVAAALGGLAILLLAIGTVNVLRDRPFRSIPEEVGKPELAAFVVVPALLPLIFGGQLVSAIVTAGANVILLGLVYAVVGYGLLSIVRWVAARLLDELSASLAMLTRAVPLLLIFSLVLFVNAEMWQVFSEIPPAFLATVAGLFIALGTVFLVARLPREVEHLQAAAGAGGPPLRRSQRINIGLVMFVSQAMQVVLVSAAVGVFFVIFGLLTVGPEARESWIGGAGNALLTIDPFGEQVAVTEELLRVAGGLAAFSGLYYAIAVLTDSTYREEFLSQLIGEMEETFRARVEYLALRERVATPAAGPPQ